MSRDRQVITIIQQLQSPKEIPSNYNGVLFINKGTQLALIDNFPLAAGESVGWQHNANEINVGTNRVDFPNGLAGASVWVIETHFKDVEY